LLRRVVEIILGAFDMHLLALLFLAWVIYSLLTGRYRSRPAQPSRPQEITVRIILDDNRRRRDPDPEPPAPLPAPSTILSDLDEIVRQHNRSRDLVR
jgi:hypothetical protein